MARKRSHGTFLTVWLVVIIVANSLRAVAACTELQQPGWDGTHAAGLVFSGLVLLGAYWTFHWQRRGPQLLIGALLVNGALGLLGADAESSGEVLGSFIGAGLMWMAVWPLWRYFNGARRRGR